MYYILYFIAYKSIQRYCDLDLGIENKYLYKGQCNICKDFDYLTMDYIIIRSHRRYVIAG